MGINQKAQAIFSVRTICRIRFLFAGVWINFGDYNLNAASKSSLTFSIDFTCMNVKSVTASPKELLYMYVDRFNFRYSTRMDYIHYNIDLHAQVIQTLGIDHVS